MTDSPENSNLAPRSSETASLDTTIVASTSEVLNTPEVAASANLLQRLETARHDLLRVHRALLAVERIRYEKARGRIENNSAFLQLVIADPWFDWLRPMAQLVLLIDERTEDKKSLLGEPEGQSLLARSTALLRADSDGDAFQRLYYQAVQFSPDLAVLARQVATAYSSR